MVNTYNNLEGYIQKLLTSIGIYHPIQLNIETIYPRLGLCVYYLPQESMVIEKNIFLDNRKDATEQWQDFTHELCHIRWHEGDQAFISVLMREYQEWKAENFSQHLCIPSFMLDRITLPNSEKEAIWLLMETFNVEYSFAKKRLNQYIRNLYSQEASTIQQVSQC